jgi:CHAD domain-containing protein
MQAQLLKFSDKCFLSLTNNLIDVWEDCSISSVHKLRLSVKKFNTLLKILEYRNNLAGKNKIVKLIDRVFLHSGYLRDNHVQILLLKFYKDKFGEEARFFISLLKNERIRNERTLKRKIEMINPFDIVLLNQRIDNVIEELDDKMIETAMKVKVDELFLQLNTLVRSDTDENTLHRIRIMLKELLHTLSIISKKNRKEYGESFISFLESLQLKLGNWHDLNGLYYRIAKNEIYRTKYISLLQTVEDDKNLLQIEAMDELIKLKVYKYVKKEGSVNTPLN